MVRFADDFIMGFERLEDAQKVRRVIDKRFVRFGLRINAEKARLGHARLAGRRIMISGADFALLQH